VLGGVGLGRADHPELLRLARLLVFHMHNGTHSNGLGVDVLLVDDARAAQLVLELHDSRLQHRLLVLGVVVLGVLGDVAELAGLLDAVSDLAALVAFEVGDLLLELLQTLCGDQRLTHS
jgi:hypothetical protein